MSFQIEILKVGVESRGKFKTATVDHKTSDGKVDSKKIQSFTFKDVFEVLTQAKPGEVFDIESKKIKNEKDGKEYWTWVAAVKKDGQISSNPTSNVKAVRSSYETPEERAARQVYIVRQSSVANAVALLARDGIPPNPAEVIAVARQFEAYVFETSGSQPQPAEVE